MPVEPPNGLIWRVSMRALGYLRNMLLAVVAFSVFACIDRGDPTAPGAPATPADVTVAVQIPVSSAEVGDVIDAAATAMNQSGQPLPSDTIEWSSSDTSVLTVSNVGHVNTRKVGTATVYAKYHNISGHKALRVTDSVPAKVVVSPSVASAAVGAQIQLSASVATRTGRLLEGYLVKWSSTDPQHASVSSSGVVTGAQQGSAKIIAVASKAADTAVVNVAAAPIARLTVTPATSTVVSGQTLQLSAHALDANGGALTGRAVGWQSSDANVASVSTAGLVRGGRIGTATITASSEGKSATATIQVTAGTAKTITIAPGSIGLVAGKTQQLTASIADSAGNAVPAQSVTWSSSSSSIATVSSSGLVTAAHAGSATITASANGATGHATVVVSTGAVKTIAITPSSVSLVTGVTKQLAATLTDAAGNTISGQAVSWSSSSSTVATVSTSGLVTANRSGSATITAAAGGASGRATLTVVAGQISIVTVTPGSASLIAGATQQLVATPEDISGSDITGQTITWSTSDASIVKVSSTGVATGAHVGQATITATASGKSGKSNFSVASGPVNSIAISPASGSVQQGKTLQLTDAFKDVAGNPVTVHSVAWTSSKSTVAAVSSSGLVTGVAVGSATITSTADGKSSTAAITVTAATIVAPAPAPPPPPPAPAPTPTPVQTACSEIPHSRLVSVSTSAQLHSALSGARPGDLIQMADGTYGDGSEFRATVAGTESQRITLCGSANAIINGGTLTSLSGVNATGANYWTFSGFTITNAQFGFYGQKSSHMILQGLTIHSIGQEAIEIAVFSKHNAILGNRIYDTGRIVAEWGEAIYIGSYYAKWCTVTGCAPDASDSTLIDGNTIGPDVRAEHVDLKEGTTGGEVRNNTFDGRGMVMSQGSGLSGYPASWVIIRGNSYSVHNNTGTTALVAGFRVNNETNAGWAWGKNNVFASNTANVSGAPYGFLIQTGSTSAGNIVKCSNSVSNASNGFASVPCQ
jgi:uncharacterized protein YjdB